MYTIVDSACLLANTFLVNSCRNEFELSDIQRISRKLSDRLKTQKIIVDWTRNNLISALENYSDMFQIRNTRVCRSPGSDQLFTTDFIDSEFNTFLSPQVIDEMKTIISSEHCECKD